MLPVLTETGMAGTAYRLLLQDTFPSWLFSVKHGATTIWERWDGWTPEKGFQDPGMNSFNHYALGFLRPMAVRHGGGHRLGPPAARLPAHHPSSPHRRRPELGQAPASASSRGPIVSALETQGRHLDAGRDDPRQYHGTVYVPAAEAAAVTESGKPAATAEGVRFLRAEPGEAVLEIGSGFVHVCQPPAVGGHQ